MIKLEDTASIKAQTDLVELICAYGCTTYSVIVRKLSDKRLACGISGCGMGGLGTGEWCRQCIGAGTLQSRLVRPGSPVG